jgi:hypothetical protein
MGFPIVRISKFVGTISLGLLTVRRTAAPHSLSPLPAHHATRK